MRLGTCLLLGWIASLAACEDDDNLTRELGLPCQEMADCTAVCLLPSPETPGGLCTRGCASDDDCPATTVCAAREGGTCLYACRDPRDCHFLQGADGVGWSCQEVEAEGGGSVLACLGG